MSTMKVVRSFDKALVMSSHASDLVIRRASSADLREMGRLGAVLLRTHYAFDPQRFMAPGHDPESGYAWFLGTQLQEADAIVLVAERARKIVGYVYAAVEPQSWKELREEAGFIHDIVVDEEDRGHGVATALIQAAIEWLASRGLPRVVLGTAAGHEQAQRLFARLGFRPTMIEMTREL
jgi:ribosomal protein S18 acetylase RimI-like enzyme